MLKIKPLNLLVVVALISGAFTLFLPVYIPRVAALSQCQDGTAIPENVKRNGSEKSFCSGRGGVDASSGNSQQPDLDADCKETNVNSDNCGIIRYLKLFINILSGLVGIIVVIMIIVGGIQYSAARNDPGAVTAAKHRITNAIIALVMYIFLYAFLQWLVPGGVLR